MKAIIIKTILLYYPMVQGIYLFGSHGAGQERADSDLDIALLLPPELAKREKNLILSECRFALEEALHREVDLLNARQVSTVMQKEIIGGRLIHGSDRQAVAEFEMLVLSYYQKLNEERKDILESFRRTKRAYTV
ncbi:MAG: nucleotidyltransferase domain-containing protein [Syntrophales bacterium]|nr:nucleotidyltransferase domain-containing protein [Syntrophales bacterium]MDD5641984.1 nucleotidyltransferase domain-containing protein [Syntrophales bacterium]